jgi:hypothetical protein
VLRDFAINLSESDRLFRSFSRLLASRGLGSRKFGRKPSAPPLGFTCPSTAAVAEATVAAVTAAPAAAAGGWIERVLKIETVRIAVETDVLGLKTEGQVGGRMFEF